MFNTEALKLSIRRINQLGYFKPIEGAPELGPSSPRTTRSTSRFKVEEQNRNQFTFGGGVSGLEGTLHQRVVLDLQLPRPGRDLPGLRPDRAADQELPVRGRPSRTSSTGRSPPASTCSSARSSTTATGLSWGTRRNKPAPPSRPASGRGASRAFLNYSYEIVDIKSLAGAATGSSSTTGTPVYNPFLFGRRRTRHESRYRPSLVYNTVDSPFTPRAGHEATRRRCRWPVALSEGP